MSTFLLFALIFIPFVWYLIRALRYTNETVGENSPLKTVVVHSVNARQHFANFYFVFILLIGFILLPTTVIMLANLDAATKIWHYGIALFLPLTMVFFYYRLYRLVQLHIRFWHITKDVVMTFDPATKSILVDSPGSSVCLRADTVKQIHHHTAESGGSKLFLGYEYYEFLDFNDRSMVLNSSSFCLYFAVSDYFRNVPTTSHSHKIPWPPVTVERFTTELCRQP